MFREFLSSLRLLAATVLLCAVAYPLAVLAVAMIIAPAARQGSLIVDQDGQVVGSRLIAQSFTRPAYLWPRPSACGYDAAAAGGSNLSPANPLVRQRAEAMIDRLQLAAGEAVPADLVTASGSGLDPHISLEAANLQAARIANARQVGENEVRALIERSAFTSGGPWGEDSLVNVLEVNLLLDRTYPLLPTTGR